MKVRAIRPMPSILAVTIPFFAIVFAGYVAARYRKLPEDAIPGLNAFVLYAALPCMLFRFGMSTPVAQLLNPGVIGVYLFSALLVVGITIVATYRKPLTLKDASFGAQAAAAPNSGFMGIPLLTTLLGAAAAGPVISSILVDLVATASLCITLALWNDVSGQGRRAAVANALRGAASNPMPWAIALGVASKATGLEPIGPIDVIIRMLSDAATPVALFTIGAVTWRASQHAHTRTPVSGYLPVALIKLLLHPLLVAATGKAAQAVGIGISDFELLVLTLAAALPSASNIAILAERYGADTGRIARIILASTSLAFVTFSALAWMLGASR